MYWFFMGPLTFGTFIEVAASNLFHPEGTCKTDNNLSPEKLRYDMIYALETIPVLKQPIFLFGLNGIHFPGGFFEKKKQTKHASHLAGKLEAQDQRVTFTIFSLKLPDEPSSWMKRPPPRGVEKMATSWRFRVELVGVGRYPNSSTNSKLNLEELWSTENTAANWLFQYIYLICIWANYCKFLTLN